MTKHVVEPLASGLAPHPEFKVGEPVVGAVPVFVVDAFPPPQVSAEVFFHHMPVLADLPAIDLKFDVAAPTEMSRAAGTVARFGLARHSVNAHAHQVPVAEPSRAAHLGASFNRTPWPFQFSVLVGPPEVEVAKATSVDEAFTRVLRTDLAAELAVRFAFVIAGQTVATHPCYPSAGGIRALPFLLCRNSQFRPATGVIAVLATATRVGCRNLFAAGSACPIWCRCDSSSRTVVLLTEAEATDRPLAIGFCASRNWGRRGFHAPSVQGFDNLFQM